MQLAKMQMDFVASVSHELRTPLAVISSAADNIADGVVSGPDSEREGWRAVDCGAEGWAKKAADELRLAHGRRLRQDLDPDALTEAELRVKALAERGVKAARIAEQLFLTVNTIESHLQHIYRKLGINSQRELMALTHAPGEPPPNGGARPRDK